MENVTEKHTKAHILNAYKNLLKKYNDSCKDQVKVKDQLVEKNRAALYGKISKLPLNPLSESVDQLASKAKNLDEKINIAKEAFNNIETAVLEKEAELKELFGIEKGCHAIVAIKEAQKDEEKALEEIKKNTEKKRSEALKEHDAMVSDLKKKYQNLLDEAQYKHERNLIQQADELIDKTKELKNAEKEFQKLREETQKVDLEFKEKLEKELLEEKEKTEEKITAIEKEIEYSMKEQEVKLKAEVEQERYKNELLNTKIDDLQLLNASLSKKLEDAYSKLQDLAKETVNSKSKDDLIERLSAVAKKQTNN